MTVWWIQRYAVIDGPNGHALVVAPSDRFLARDLRGEQSFHCSTRAGGCGQPLILRAGDVNIPHFAHEARNRQCDADADRWTHMHVQRLLHNWLTAQGREVTLEQQIPGGRLDLAVHTIGGLIALEVQRALVDEAAWQDRTTIYRNATRGLSWLWMDDAAAAGLRMELGQVQATHSIEIRFDPGNDNRSRLQVQARTRYQTGGWAALGACTLKAEGLRTPDWHQLRTAPTKAQQDPETRQEDEGRTSRAAYERYYWAWNSARPGIAATSIERAWRLKIPPPGGGLPPPN